MMARFGGLMQVVCILGRAAFCPMTSPPLLRRPPLLLRGAGWRLGVAAVFSAALLLLWRWALQGGGG